MYTSVRLQSGPTMCSPNRCVFGVWLSFAVLPEIRLSSQVMESPDSIRIPALEVTLFELLRMVLPTIWFLSPDRMSMPSMPAFSM